MILRFGRWIVTVFFIEGYLFFNGTRKVMNAYEMCIKDQLSRRRLVIADIYSRSLIIVLYVFGFFARAHLHNGFASEKLSEKCYWNFINYLYDSPLSPLEQESSCFNLKVKELFQPFNLETCTLATLIMYSGAFWTVIGLMAQGVSACVLNMS